MNKHSPLLAVLIAAAATASLEAYACECKRPASVNRAIESARAVFVGTVMEKGEVLVDCRDEGCDSASRLIGEGGKEYGLYDRITFDVRTAWKGVDRSTITISNERSTCHYSFNLSQTYLVYANESANGKLEVTICNRTAPVYLDGEPNWEADADISDLEKAEYVQEAR